MAGTESLSERLRDMAHGIEGPQAGAFAALIEADHAALLEAADQLEADQQRIAELEHQLKIAWGEIDD